MRLLASIAAALALTAIASAAGTKTIRAHGARLTVPAGWHQVPSADDSAPQSRLAGFCATRGWLVQRAGADNPSLVVAVTARDASAVHPVILFGSFKKLSPNGILVWADTVGRGRAGFPPAIAWPPQLARFRVDRGWEGQPAANIQQRVWVGAVRGWDLDIRVFFGTQRPSTALLVKAQAELSRLRLPSVS